MGLGLIHVGATELGVEVAAQDDGALCACSRHLPGRAWSLRSIDLVRS